MRLTMAEKRVLIKSFAPPLPEEGQEGKGGSADGVYPDDGLQPLLWGLSAAPPGQACLAEPQSWWRWEISARECDESGPANTTRKLWRR